MTKTTSTDLDDRHCGACGARPGLCCTGPDGYPQPEYHDARSRGFLRPVQTFSDQLEQAAQR